MFNKLIESTTQKQKEIISLGLRLLEIDRLKNKEIEESEI